MFVAGPPVVKRLGEDLTKEELGGADIHTHNGAVDDDAANEHEAFGKARRFLSYLPSSVFELPPSSSLVRSSASIPSSTAVRLREMYSRSLA